MQILRFAFGNHQSFRDDVDLVMVLPSLQTVVPPAGESWTDHTARVAAIYGPNASGKSGVLDALQYMKHCIRSSSKWSGRESMPRHPFALNETSKQANASFVLDFVMQGVRHEYGFVLSPSRVVEEWLFAYPSGRRRVMFERDEAITFGRLPGGGTKMLESRTKPSELVLSRAALLEHSVLSPIRDAIVRDIEVARFGEYDRESRLKTVIDNVSEGTLSLDDLHTMLRVADIGIVGAEIQEGEASPRTYKIFKALVENDTDEDEDEDEAKSSKVPSDDELREIFNALARSLMFRHAGESEKAYNLASSVQSTGTLTWLSLAAPAIRALRRGAVLAIDELDASLHPQLAQVMVQMFRDESVNPAGAQLIFTTHDTYFMSPSSDTRLTPEEVWFVEKGRDGASDLYRMSDFPTRSDQNLSRRYLQGRYGAVPSVAPAFLAALVGASETNDDVAPEPEKV